MKKRLGYLYYGMLALLLFTGINFSQDNSENSLKTTLDEIFSNSKAKTYEKAAVLLVYNGEDKARNGVDTFNPANADELDQVKRICKKISALLDISEQHLINKIEAVKIKGSDGYKVIVGFKSGDQTLETSFEFIKLSKGYALLNVN